MIQDSPRRRLLARAMQGAGALLVAGALAVGASAVPVAAGQAPPSDCAQSEPAGGRTRGRTGAGSGGGQTNSEPEAPACDESERCDPRDEPVEDGGPSEEPSDAPEEPSPGR